MQYCLVVRVVELEYVAVVAVAERRGWRRHARSADHACVRPAAHIHQHLEPWREPRCGAAGNRRAEIVEQLAPDACARGFGHLRPAQR